MAATAFASRPRKGAGFLFLLGFALVGAGVGLAFAPQYSWQVAKIAQRAHALGLENGALLVAGLVCFGLGIVARVASSAALVPDTRAESEALQSELHLYNEQLSTKLAQLRTSVVQLQESVGALAHPMQALAQAHAEGGKSGATDVAQDAVFRLAASLDKLHAHLDERVHAVDLQLRSGFESLLNASQEVRRCLSQGGFASPEPGASLPEVAPPAAEPARGDESGIAFYETMQKLDAIAGEAGEAGELGSALPQPHPQPDAPFPSTKQDLDLLLPEEYRDRY